MPRNIFKTVVKDKNGFMKTYTLWELSQGRLPFIVRNPLGETVVQERTVEAAKRRFRGYATFDRLKWEVVKEN